MITDDNNSPEIKISEVTKREIKGSVIWISLFAIIQIIINVILFFSCISSGYYVFIIFFVVGIYLNFILVMLGTYFNKFSNGGNINDFELAIEKQKQYWRAIFVITIIGIILYIILFFMLLN
jgi:hypothetical protein